MIPSKPWRTEVTKSDQTSPEAFGGSVRDGEKQSPLERAVYVDEETEDVIRLNDVADVADIGVNVAPRGRDEETGSSTNEVMPV